MNTQKHWRTRLQNYLLLGSEDLAALKEVLPFFLLVTIVVGGFLLQNIRSTDFASPGLRAGFIVLSVLHVAMYWIMLFFMTSERRTIYYLVIQGALAFSLIQISADFNLAIVLYGALLGNSVGALGKKRITIVAVVLFLTLAAANLVLLNRGAVMISWFLSALPAILMASFFAYFFNQQITARNKLQELLDEIETAHSKLAKYTIQVENLTITAERQRMARELHDTLAQGLAGLILQLEAAEHHNQQGQTEKTQQIITQAMERARTTLADARSAISDLRAELNDVQALKQALTDEVHRFENQTGIDCQFTLSLPDQLDEQICEHVLRTAAEGLWNIAQHAQAQHASLSVQTQPDGLHITIQDDGTGFDPQAAQARDGHYGLMGIRERARLVGGTLAIESTAGQGTQLQVHIPLLEALDE